VDAIQFFIPKISHIEGDDLDDNSEKINHLTSDKNEEPSMIPGSNAAIDPWTMVIVSFNTSFAYVAMVTSWYLDNLAFKAKFMHGECL